MSPRIRPSSAATLLTSIPEQLGFRPRDSLVLVPICGRETRGILRIDLPAEPAVDAAAATAVGYVCRIPDAQDIIIVVYTDGPISDGAGIAHEALVSVIGDRADACGLGVTGELCVGSDGWAYYDDAVHRPLSEIAGDGEGSAGSSQHDGAEVTPDPAGASRVAARFRDLSRSSRDAFGRVASDDPPAVGKKALDAVLADLDDDPHAFFDAALAGDAPPSPDRDAVWQWILRCPALRDVVLTQWSGGVDEARRAFAWQSRWLAGHEDAPDFPLRLAGEGSRPNPDRLNAARDFVRDLATRAAGANLAACLAVCGWLSWALGNSTHAANYASRARDLDPELSFGDLLMRLADRGVVPGWAFDPSGSSATAPWLFAQPAAIP